ncbi:zinc finger protein 677-like [Oppia nitens]|uniref:zinc finger protein 677-like n=1 Tax=Oppia nitens TaxID=1686743 RepID=UPI0023DC56B9|nr:zinc finger protein 677-like [Oppia nitens]
MMTSMVVTIDDILDQLWSENKRLLKELLFSNKCLNILNELKTELNLIYKKFETQLITEDTFNHLRHQLNYICDQRRDKGLHLNDVNLDEDNEQRCKSKTTMNDIIIDDISDTQDFDIDLYEGMVENERQDKSTFSNIENKQVMNNKIKFNDNIIHEENENVVQINQSNNIEIIENKTKDNHILDKQLNERKENRNKDLLKHKSNKQLVIRLKKNKCKLKGLTDSEEKNNKILIKTKKNQPKSGKRKSINDKNNDQLDKQRVIQSKPGGYKCLNSDCQMTFKTLQEYRKHQTTCIINCSECDKKYKCQKSYVFHQMKEHGSSTIELPYKCDYNDCNYETGTSSMLRQHRIKHSTDRPFVCNIDGCGKSFKTMVNCDIHREIHSEKKYVCTADGCHRRFKQKSQYGRHLAEHRSKPTLKCPEKDCRKRFYTDRDIYRHRIDDHKHKFCHKKLYKRCDWPGCDYYGTYLNRHKLIHTGEKNYRCDWPECGKRFGGSKQKLIEHMNIHNNIKPFACRWPGCEYRCANHSNVSKHIKQVHQK